MNALTAVYFVCLILVNSIGMDGLQGEPGLPGPRGYDGGPGLKGEHGLPGFDGVKGDKGDYGRPGVRGALLRKVSKSINKLIFH